MGRRNRNPDIFDLVPLIALLSLGVMFIPAVRQMLLGLGFIVLVCLLIVIIVFFVIRIFKDNSQTSQTTPFTNYYSSSPSPQPINLIENLRTIDWFQFEKVVELTYEKLGYSVTRRGGANPDGGIDLIIEKDGQQKAVQCKQWKTWNVGVKAVREFLGALTDAGIDRGVFVTLGGYSGDAKLLAEKHGIEMLNETELARMLESVDAENDSEVLSLLEDTTKYCPKCEREMVLRTASKGLNAGNQFWGCSGYPRCRFTMQV